MPIVVTAKKNVDWWAYFTDIFVIYGVTALLEHCSSRQLHLMFIFVQHILFNFRNGQCGYLSA